MFPRQYDLFGQIQAPQDLDLHSKVAYILEQHPEARDDDRLLVLWFWWEWNSLACLLTAAQFQDLLVWVMGAEQPETIRRRRQEIQMLRSGVGTLQPSASTAAHRREQDSAGPPSRTYARRRR
jgi:hypothetical protein